MPLVTSARFAKRNGRGREGDRADRQPVERSKARVGHGGINVERMNNAAQVQLETRQNADVETELKAHVAIKKNWPKPIHFASFSPAYLLWQ